MAVITESLIMMRDSDVLDQCDISDISKFIGKKMSDYKMRLHMEAKVFRGVTGVCKPKPKKDFYGDNILEDE